MNDYIDILESATWNDLVELRDELDNTLGITQQTFSQGILDAVSWFGEAQQFLADIETYIEANPPHDIKVGDMINVNVSVLEDFYDGMIPTDLKQHLDKLNNDKYEVVIIQENSVIINGYYRIPLSATESEGA